MSGARTPVALGCPSHEPRDEQLAGLTCPLGISHCHAVVRGICLERSKEGEKGKVVFNNLGKESGQGVDVGTGPGLESCVAGRTSTSDTELPCLSKDKKEVKFSSRKWKEHCSNH